MADPCPCDQLLNKFCLEFREAVTVLLEAGVSCSLPAAFVEWKPVFDDIVTAFPPSQQLGFCDQNLKSRAASWAKIGAEVKERWDAGKGVAVRVSSFVTPTANCPDTLPPGSFWAYQISWAVVGPDIINAKFILDNCCQGGEGMAVDEVARACCADATKAIEDLKARVALLELQMEGAQILATEQAGRITRLHLFLEPVGKFGSQGDHFDLWLRDRAINDTAVQVALLVGMEIALRVGGVATRQIFVSVIVDALGKWLLDVIKAAISVTPDSVSVDPEGGEDQVPTPQFITILDFVGSKSAQIGSADVAQASLDGGSSKETGGSAAYGPAVASTGQGIGGLLASFGTGLADGLARGLKAGDITPSEEAREEEDPIWAVMRRSIFGTAEQPPLTDEEIAEIVRDTTTVVETPPAEEGQPPQEEGPPAEEGQPPQPGEPEPTPPAEEGQPPQGPTPTPPAPEGQPPQG